MKTILKFRVNSDDYDEFVSHIFDLSIIPQIGDTIEINDILDDFGECTVDQVVHHLKNDKVTVFVDCPVYFDKGFKHDKLLYVGYSAKKLKEKLGLI